MGGVDAIVFTAGLGENSPFMRDKICNGLEYLGTRIDPDLNQVRGKEREISVRRARVKFCYPDKRGTGYCPRYI